MKKILFLFGMIAISAMVFTACSSSSPEAVAEKFLVHMAKGEFEKAAALGTDQTKQLLSMLSAFSEVSETETAEGIPQNMRCEVDGDRATCYYELEGDTEEIALKKIDGKWKVHLEK